MPIASVSIDSHVVHENGPSGCDLGSHGVGIVHVWVNGSWQARGSACLWKTWYRGGQHQGAVFLSAKHVLACAATEVVSSVSVSLGTLTAIASGVWSHHAKDLAVLWFRKAFVFNEKRTATRQFYTGDWCALKGTLARCFGCGKEHARPGPPARANSFVIEDVVFDALGCASSLTLRAAKSATFLSGDSGGACMVSANAGQGSTIGGILTAGGTAAGARRYAAATVISANDRAWLSKITQCVS